ncbi:hypothetical protein J6590_024122 [Homalodisca vitripennis]|nr:hypothetical protein J6590_024122 [Homalodisca vitripennis]
MLRKLRSLDLRLMLQPNDGKVTRGVLTLAYVIPDLTAAYHGVADSSSSTPGYCRYAIFIDFARHRHLHKLCFTFLLVQRLESDAVTNLTLGICSLVLLKRSKKVGDGELKMKSCSYSNYDGSNPQLVVPYRTCRLTNAFPDDSRCIEDRARFGARVRSLLLGGGLWGVTGGAACCGHVVNRLQYKTFTRCVKTTVEGSTARSRTVMDPMPQLVVSNSV